MYIDIYTVNLLPAYWRHTAITDFIIPRSMTEVQEIFGRASRFA
jgi:hypothetical protein